MLLCLTLLFAACSDKSATSNEDAEASKNEANADVEQSDTEVTNVEAVDKNKIYVSADWLYSLIKGEQPQSENYVILEASWGEPGDVYKKTHIPGAIHMNTDLIEESTYWNIRTPEEIEKVFKDFGITKDTVALLSFLYLLFIWWILYTDKQVFVLLLPILGIVLLLQLLQCILRPRIR